MNALLIIIYLTHYSLLKTLGNTFNFFLCPRIGLRKISVFNGTWNIFIKNLNISFYNFLVSVLVYEQYL